MIHNFVLNYCYFRRQGNRNPSSNTNGGATQTDSSNQNPQSDANHYPRQNNRRPFVNRHSGPPNSTTANG
jgi:hypothetical protein